MQLAVLRLFFWVLPRFARHKTISSSIVFVATLMMYLHCPSHHTTFTAVNCIEVYNLTMLYIRFGHPAISQQVVIVSEVYFVRPFGLPFYHLAPVLLHSLHPLDLQCKNISQNHSKITIVGQNFCSISNISNTSEFYVRY